MKYVESNPYFRADTDKLRSYAARIDRVNARLANLDLALQGLYAQVELDDILTIVNANLLTNVSPTLIQIKNYLNNTATRLENAENKARGYVGG